MKSDGDGTIPSESAACWQRSPVAASQQTRWLSCVCICTTTWSDPVTHREITRANLDLSRPYALFSSSPRITRARRCISAEHVYGTCVYRKIIVYRIRRLMSSPRRTFGTYKTYCRFSLVIDRFHLWPFLPFFPPFSRPKASLRFLP